jgi:hypothetical protein
MGQQPRDITAYQVTVEGNGDIYVDVAVRSE